MVTRDTPWPAGTPCWVDIMTSDTAAARAFYGELFGWNIAVGTEETGHYGMADIDGRSVAGIGQLMGENTPVAWTTYLATTDADATAAAISQAGGTLIAAPMDVMEFGRMIIAADPTGAVFGVWQANQHRGVGIANESNALTWNEVLSRDYARAKDFYAAVFGYTYTDMGAGGFHYSTFEVDGSTVGGIGGLPAEVPDSVPAHWRAYFAVDDCDAAVEKVTSLGGSVLRPAEDMPYGRHADVQDPQGGMFAVIKPASPQ